MNNRYRRNNLLSPNINLKKFAEECSHESKVLMKVLRELKLNYKCKNMNFCSIPS